MGVNLFLLGYRPPRTDFPHATLCFWLGVSLQFASFVLGLVALLFGPPSLKASLSALPIVLNLFVSMLFSKCCINDLTSKKYWGQDIALMLLLTAGMSLSCSSFFVAEDASNAAGNSTSTLATKTLLTDATGEGAAALIAQIRSPLSLAIQIVVLFLAVLLAGYTIGNHATANSKKYLMPLAAGTFSAMSFHFFKCAVVLLADAWSPLVWLYAIWTLLCTVMGVLTVFASLNALDEHYESQLFITVYTISGTLWSVLLGGVVFSDFAEFQAASWGMFGAGLGVSLLALVVWAYLRSKRQDPGYVPVGDEKI